MKKIILVIIITIIIVVGGVTFFIFFKPTSIEDNLKPGLTILSPQPNEEITLPYKVRGYINGDGWNAFEGQAGLVRLLDSQDNYLALVPLSVQGDWTKEGPLYFEADLQYGIFPSDSGKAGLEFVNENPSGLSEKDQTFWVPIKILIPDNQQVVEVFFSLDDSYNRPCDYLFNVYRLIPKTQAVARAALEELLKGPIGLEKNSHFTNINPNVKIQSLKIENGIAYVDFNEALEEGVGGSCKVTAIRAQITQTLKQFSSVKDVIISINGRTEDILQP